MSFNFVDFPDEIIANITSYLKPKDEATVNILSKRFVHLKPSNYAYLFKDAISYGDYEYVIFKYVNVVGVLDHFLKRRVSNKYIDKLFINACNFGYIQIVDMLLKDSRVNPAENKNSPIIFASIRGHTDVIDRLLKDDRVDPSDQNNLAIRESVCFNQIDVVKRLLKDPRVDATAQYGQALYNAMTRNNLEMIKLLSMYIGNYIKENKKRYLNSYLKSESDPNNEVYKFIKNFE